jgi:hypothetical protein
MDASKIEVFVEFSIGTPKELAMKEAARVLRDVTRYKGVPKVELFRSSCTLNKEQVQYLVDIGFWSFLSEDDMKDIKGVCKVFTNDEPWKDPPRARVITWTWTVNLDMSLKIPFELFNQATTRHLVHEGPMGATIDGKSAFNLFAYSFGVSMYHCVHTPLGWCRINRSAMGARPSCFVADTALGVLAEGVETKCSKTYVDNLLLVAPAEMLRRDLMHVKGRADKAGYIFNEDFSDLDKLIREELEFLGLMLNFKGKTVALGPKVLAKLATIWLRRADWNVKDFIVCICVLVYTANVLGRDMGPFQKLLQLWARAQGECMAEPEALKAGIARVKPEVWELLKQWVTLTLENKPLPVPAPGATKHDFVMVSDACVKGWCCIFLSCKTGQCTIARDLMKHSVIAEPMAVAAGCNTFLEKHVVAKVLHVGDNTATVGEINRGYSTREGRFLAEHLHTTYPGLTLNSDYYPGEIIPTDEGSRGEATSQVKLEALAALYAVDVTDIREVTL